MRIPIARRSWPYLLICSFFVILGFCLHWIVGVIILLPTILLFNFFRDPERKIPDVPPGTLLSPADGKVISIIDSPHPDWQGKTRISIFMNIFNVHVNRAPAQAKLVKMRHFPGQFLAADKAEASEVNERMECTFQSDKGLFLVVQVAGLVARRIYTWAKPDDVLLQGQRYGLIKLGSRLDVHVPGNGKFLVQPGDKVFAGITPIYSFKDDSGE